ncbi:hypothetical protein PLANPX_3423 [Lacipirellula parvula]|uniref:Uncharacterized protein n=1 Tax=Lacipirellula parvula TaxID=2650471 RepID=A0A5K7XG04_9BACT|nr:hypothetical protein PLANPX_3423 [Lacipirellula parvula]
MRGADFEKAAKASAPAVQSAAITDGSEESGKRDDSRIAGLNDLLH